MNEVYLKEAFKALRLLEEDEEDIDPEKNTFNLKMIMFLMIWKTLMKKVKSKTIQKLM